MASFLISDFLLGIIVGLMSSILGLGGGILLVPSLIFFFGFPQHVAVATSLLTIGFVSSFNVLRFQLKAPIKWKIILGLGFTGGLFSFSAGRVAGFLPEKLLLIFFVIVLMFLIIKTIYAKENPDAESAKHTVLKGSLRTGAIAGLISGLTGVGGGSILTPMLLAREDLPKKMVVPLANAFMMITALAAAAAYALQDFSGFSGWVIGSLHLDTALLIFAGSVPAAYLGTHFQDRISLQVRKVALLFFLILILVKMSMRLFST